MNFKIKCEKLKKEDELGENMYLLDIRTYKGQIIGKFEKSELRYMIEKIDNSID